MSYFLVLGIPTSLMILILCDQAQSLYFRPLYKRAIYSWLATLLIVFTVLAVAFMLSFALYLSQVINDNNTVG